MESIQRQFANLCYNRFIDSNSCNYESVIYILNRFIPGDKILTLYFLLKLSRIKLTVVLLRILLLSTYPLNKLETIPTLKSVVSQDLALQQVVSRLQTASADLWTVSINITSPFRIHYPLLNPTELRHYRITFIILLPSIEVYSSSNSSSSSSSYIHSQCSPVVGPSLLAST
jgi:hypothetical protein